MAYTNVADRFIPLREKNGDNLHILTRSPENYIKSYQNHNKYQSYQEDYRSYVKYLKTRQAYNKLLSETIIPKRSRLLNFSKKSKLTPPDSEDVEKLWPVNARKRPVISHPTVILDIPDLKTDISHQQVDWGSSGIVATIHKQEIFIYNPDLHGDISFSKTNRFVGNCLKWNFEGTHIAFALEASGMYLWDACASKLCGVFICNCPGVCITTAIESTSCFFIAGCSLGKLSICNKDLTRVTSVYNAHSKEIIKIAISCNEKFMATSALDCCIRIWSIPSCEELFEIKHYGPVRALAWHPWRPPIMVIGEGHGKGVCSLWNVNSPKLIISDDSERGGMDYFIDCLTFNPISAELVVSYWYHSNDADCFSEGILVQRDFKTVVDGISYHTTRTPYLMWSKDGTRLATAGADENFCIWEFFNSSEKRMFKRDTGKKYSTNNMDNLNIFGSTIR